MYSAKNVTEHVEASRLVCYKSHVKALTRRKRQPVIEIVTYRKTVSLGCVVVHDVNDNVLTQRDIHFGPWTRMILTTIEAYVESLICHDYGENRGTNRATWSERTVWWTRSEKMESISGRDKTYSNYR